MSWFKKKSVTISTSRVDLEAERARAEARREIREAKRVVLEGLGTDDGVKSIATVLSGWAAQGREEELTRRSVAGTARNKFGCFVRGDDLVHPHLGTFVGAAKSMGEARRNRRSA